MKIKYYGTSAAEGIPGLFCDCENCRYAREKGGRNIRTRSQALISDKLLIDLPPDTLYHVQQLGLPLHEISHLFITHAHSDHLLSSDLLEKQERHAHSQSMKPINVYGSLPTIDKIFSTIHKKVHVNSGRWILQEIMPFTPVTADNFTVTPLKAAHAYELCSYIYDIFDGEKRMLYAHDTGYFLDEAWEYLSKQKLYYKLISLDCTAGISDSCSEHHMNLEMCRKVRERLISLCCADDKTIFVLHHFSHNCGASYDSLLPIAHENGFEVSYDGMEIEF